MNKEKTIIKIANEIHASGGTVFCVGGAVRDEVLGLQNKDIDVEIHGISVNEVVTILKKFGEIDTVGAAFGILIIKGYDIDFAFPRTENNIGKSHKDFAVSVDPFMGVAKAARRRDFTMNAIMKNIVTGEIVDPFGGIRDIENKVIRMVNEETFIEDPLRILRAAQFASRLNFAIDENITRVAKTLDLTHLSSERIVVELNKLMESKHPEIGLKFLHETGVFEQILPGVFSENFFKKVTAIERTTEVNTRFSILFNHLKPNELKLVKQLFNNTSFNKMITEVNEKAPLFEKLHSLSTFQLRMLAFKTLNNELLLSVMAAELNLELSNEIEFMNNMVAESAEKNYVIRPARLITGTELIKLGHVPGKAFGETLQAALVGQFQGLSKNQLLEKFAVHQ